MNCHLTPDEINEVFPGTACGTLPGPRVLVVDDDRLQRTLHGAMLAIAGFETDCAADGEEALLAMVMAPFDLVLADRQMPRLDGCNLVRALRAAGICVPVVMLSGSLPDEGVPDDLRDKIAEALPRTAPTREIIAAITRALRRHPSVPGMTSKSIIPLSPPQLSPPAKAVHGSEPSWKTRRPRLMPNTVPRPKSASQRSFAAAQRTRQASARETSCGSSTVDG